jgi:hypothetical protein
MKNNELVYRKQYKNPESQKPFLAASLADWLRF